MASSKKVATSQSRDGSHEGLSVVPVTLAELPIWLMERLYYRPVPVRKELTAKEANHHQELGGGAAVHYLRKYVWPREETVVNKCLQAVLMAMPPKAVANAMNAVVPGANLVHPVTVRLKRPKKLAKFCGEPDFLLFDDDNKSLVIGEIKIGAKATNGRCSFQQLQKYMQLGLLARAYLKLRHIRHLIVVPSPDIAQHCEDPDYWEPDVAKDGSLLSGNPRRFLTMRAVYEVSGAEMAQVLPLDVREYMQPVDPKYPLLPIPTYVTTWEKLCQQLSDACASTGAPHLKPACEVLADLGVGRFGLPER